MPEPKYSLPSLLYNYGELSPFMSEEQLKIHHTKHHNAYASGANELLVKFDNHLSMIDFDIKAFSKTFAFQVNGFYLHNLFWENLAPPGNGGGGAPDEKLHTAIKYNFGTLENFKKAFTQCAMSVEGSGWAVLGHDTLINRLLPMQIEKHNVHQYLNFNIILVLDMFEHAYYIDYKNEKAKYIDAFWEIINWNEMEKRISE